MSDSDSPGLGLGGLFAGMTPQRAEGLWYSGKSLRLDGYQFVECRFDRCRLFVENGSHVSLTRCFIGDETVFVFGHSAISAIKLFNVRMESFYTNYPVWVPQRDSEGRISLNPVGENPLLSGLLGSGGNTNG
jgi:hypothetical protein